MGLSRHPAVTYLAAYKSLLVVYGCVAGGVALQEFGGFTPTQWVAFPSAVAVVVVGLYALPPPITQQRTDGKKRAAVERDDEPLV